MTLVRFLFYFIYVYISSTQNDSYNMELMRLIDFYFTFSNV